MPAISAATGKVLSTGSPIDDDHRLASYDSSLVVNGDVDCERRRRNVYDKKPQRYAEDDRTAHLTTRNDKSVAYVTNNKIHYSTFCTVYTDRHEARAASLRQQSYTCHKYIGGTVIPKNTYIIRRQKSTVLTVTPQEFLDGQFRKKNPQGLQLSLAFIRKLWRFPYM